MHKGKIKKLVRDKGFGFISAVDGREIFFYQGSLLDIRFEDLNEGTELEFEVEKSPKGPRALNVRTAKVG